MMYRERWEDVTFNKLLALIVIVVLAMGAVTTCHGADCLRMAITPDNEFFYLDTNRKDYIYTLPQEPPKGPGYVLVADKDKGEWVTFEYLVVDWEDVMDCPYGDCMPIYGMDGTRYSYPTHRERVIKHFKTIEEVTEYLQNFSNTSTLKTGGSDTGISMEQQPEVYQAIPVKLKCEVQEDTSWHLQKDVKKTYKWEKEK